MNTIYEAILHRFGKDHAVAFEVAKQSGSTDRYADVIAVGLWSSRGNPIIGMEVKVSRSDWLRELKQAAKAEAFVGYCHQWYIVSPPGVVKEGELPPGWGHLLFKDGALRQVVKSTLPPPKPMTHQRWVSLLRRVHEGAEKRRVLAAQSLVRPLREEIEKRVEQRTADIRDRMQRTLKMIADIKAATGIDLGHYWRSDDFIKRIRAAEKLERHVDFIGRVLQQAQLFEKMFSTANELRSELNALLKDDTVSWPTSGNDTVSGSMPVGTDTVSVPASATVMRTALTVSGAADA